MGELLGETGPGSQTPELDFSTEFSLKNIVLKILSQKLVFKKL